MTPSRAEHPRTAPPSLRLVHPDVSTSRPASDPGVETDDFGIDVRLSDAMDAFAVLRAQNARLIDRVSESMRITPTDLRALIHVSTHEGTTPKQIAEHLGLTTGAMTALVDRVEAAGLAERAANPSDRRSLLVQLTESGREAVTFGGQVYAAAFAAAIPEDQLETVSAAFLRLADELGTSADRFG